MRFLILLSVLLIGCTSPSGIVRGTGEIVPAPYGFDAHCAIDPGPECPK